ncbi:MAG: hypothetical protein ACOX3C_00765 [Bacilli bacterium]
MQNAVNIEEVSKKNNSRSLFVALFIISLAVCLGLTVSFLYLCYSIIWERYFLLLIFYIPANILLLGFVATITVSLNVYLMKNKPTKAKNFIPSFVVLGLALISILFVVGNKVAFEIHYSFTIEKWTNALPKERYLYMKSFLKKYDLKTFDDEKIVEHLGEPDFKKTTELATEPPAFGGYHYSYYLGFPGFHIDPVYFDIKTNEHSQVTYFGYYYS